MRKNKVHNVSAKEARDSAKTVPDVENDAAAAAVIQGLFMISVYEEPVYQACHTGWSLGSWNTIC